MFTLTKILTGLLLTLLLSCQSQQMNITKTNVADTSHKKINTILRQYDKNQSNPLFVFAGEKLEVVQLPHEQGSMDKGFKCKYKIVEKVFGEFPFDTIEFVAYDHYGTPAFSKYTNVLLFVSEDSGYYYHQEYLFNDIYKTKDGRWAGSYVQYDYEHENNRYTKIKPVKIDFAEKVSYPTKIIDANGRTWTRSYPKPYFKTVGDTAFAVYGNYVDELFILQKEGVLTARALFKDGKLKQ